MQRSIIHFPNLKYRTFDWRLNVRGRAANESITGTGQVVMGVLPRWECSAQIVLKSKADTLLWRAVIGQMKGRINIARIKVLDPLRPSLADAGVLSADIAAIGRGVPFDDDAFFDDDAGFDQSLNASLSVAASAGATSITVNGNAWGDSVQAGHMIGIDDWIYRVSGVSGSASARVLNIEPALRRDASLGASVTADPYALMVFEADTQSVETLQLGLAPAAFVEIRLLEHINRD
jgi:hypothetical protein